MNSPRPAPAHLPDTAPAASRRPVRNRRQAFTLAELLVAMTVLVLLMVMVTQMVGSTSRVTGMSQARVDADSEARLVFERMGHDFDGMIRRPDVDCSIYPYANSFKSSASDTSKNDSLYFFAQGNAMLSDSNRNKPTQDAVGIVGYRVWENLSSNNSAATNPRTPFYGLDRLGVCTALYTPFDRGMLFLSSALDTATNTMKPSYLTNAANVDKRTTLIGGGSGGTYPTATQLTDLNYHSLGASVFRLEFGLQLKDGTYFQATDPTQKIQDMRDASALIVTIALMDRNARKKIPGYNPLTPTPPYTADMQNLINALADGATPEVATQWDDTVAKLASNTESPAANVSALTRRLAAQNIHVYQRVFPLR